MKKHILVVTTTTITGSGTTRVEREVRAVRASKRSNQCVGVYFRRAFGASGALRSRHSAEASYAVIERAIDGFRR